jgi:hypothetical protein
MNGPAMSTTKKYEPWQQNLIKRFATQYAIRRSLAEQCLVAGDWNWARAFDKLAMLAKKEMGLL